MEIKSGVYVITNIVNGKIYIGSSVNIKKRWTQHKYKLNKGAHANKYLQRAWNKYGVDKFEFIILNLIDKPNKNVLIQQEQKYLDIYKPYNKEIGYNILKKSNSSLGVKRSDETKLKNSLSKIEFWKNEKNRKNMIYSFNNVRDNKKSAFKISKTIKEKELAKGKNNSMYGTNCFKIWCEKYGINIALKKREESLEKNKKLNSGKNNAMFGLERPEVASKNKELKSKLVLLFDADNNLVESYKSITEAADNSNFSRSSIKKSLYNKVFVKNNIWKYGK